MEDMSINRIYVRKTDFQSKDEFKLYVAKTLQTLTSVESNIVVAYQSMDPNIYIIEVNTTDPTLNIVFPFWITPDELLGIKRHRETVSKKQSKFDFDNFGGNDDNNGGFQA